MLRAACLFLLVGGALGYGYYVPKKTTKKCYQCQYVPPKTSVKTIFKRETFTKRTPITKVHCWYQFEFDGKASEAQDRREADCSYHKPTCKAQTRYKTITLTRQVPIQVKEMSNSGGFEACKGPLTVWSAKKAGVDAWECHSNCYIRKDHHGRITRGCYKDELDVDPHMLGCNHQGDAMYCFCEDNMCNGV